MTSGGATAVPHMSELAATRLRPNRTGLSDEDLLKLVAEGTASLTGDAFFYSLTAHLAAALGAQYVFVSEFTEPHKRVRTLAFLVGEHFIDNFEYDIAGTVCEQVLLRGQVVHYPSGISAIFPHDRLATELGADSFLAVPLLGASGEVLGHLAAADIKPMPGGARDMRVFKIFGARAAAELERLRVETALRTANQELARTLQSLKATQARLVQSEKMASLGTLVAGILHEINSPIAAAKAVSDVIPAWVTRIEDVLRRSDFDAASARELGRSLDGIRESVKVTKMATHRVAKVVTNLKKFARLDEAEYQEMDLHEAMDATLRLLDYQFADRIDVIKHYGDLPNIRGYANLLNQVFMNVLLNAVEAIDGEGTITIRTLVERDRVRIEISDTGKGILADDLAKIFDPGFTTKGVGVGTGLGLAISYNIVEKHGGRITVESEPGAGTTFTIALPIDPGDESRRRLPQQTGEAHRRPNAGTALGGED